jgi:hypothetical protein
MQEAFTRDVVLVWNAQKNLAQTHRINVLNNPHCRFVYPLLLKIKMNIMDTVKNLPDFNFAQIAWVVKDIKAAEKFFRDTIGISSFGETAVIRSQDFEGTYYGKRADTASLVSMAYAGGLFIELIQPVSGLSIFQDYLDANPAGGVQHIAFSVPIAAFDQAVSGLADKGYPMVAEYNTSIAKIVFFDTSKDIGVMTEIMGITPQGEEAVRYMKGGDWEASKKKLYQE